MALNLRRATATAALVVVLAGALTGCRVAYTDTPGSGGGIDRTPAPSETTTAPEPTQPTSKPGSYSTPMLIEANTTLSFETLFADHGAEGEVHFIFADPSATLSVTGGGVLTVGESDGLRVEKTDLGYDFELAGYDGWTSIGSPESGFLDFFLESE